MLTLGILAAIIRNPAMMQELENGNDDYGRFGGEVLPTPLSKIDPPYAYRDHSLNYRKSLFSQPCSLPPLQQIVKMPKCCRF